MKKSMKYTLLTSLLLMIISPSQAKLIFHQDWEEDEVSSAGPGFACTNQCNYSHSATTSEDQVRNGKKSLKFLVKEGDFAPGERIRCTLNTDPGGSIEGKRILPYDEDRWFGFSVWIRRESNMIGHGIMNIHGHNWGAPECSYSPGGPPIALSIKGPAYSWAPDDDPNWFRWRLLSNTPNNGAGDGDLPGNETLWQEDANDELEQWVDFVFHMKLSYGQGILEMWKDGKLVYSNKSFTLAGYNLPKSCGDFYPKISAGTVSPYAPILAYQDSHRWGDENSSYAEVDPAQKGIIPPPAPFTTESLIEAEAGTLSDRMESFTDITVSGEHFIRINGTGKGSADFNIDVEQAGAYQIVGRVYVFSKYNDTLLVSLDGSQEELWQFSLPFQQWSTVTYPKILDLSKGTHTIQFSESNHSARLDYFTVKSVSQTLITPPAGFHVLK